MPAIGMRTSSSPISVSSSSPLPGRGACGRGGGCDGRPRRRAWSCASRPAYGLWPCCWPRAGRRSAVCAFAAGSPCRRSRRACALHSPCALVAVCGCRPGGCCCSRPLCVVGGAFGASAPRRPRSRCGLAGLLSAASPALSAGCVGAGASPVAATGSSALRLATGSRASSSAGTRPSPAMPRSRAARRRGRARGTARLAALARVAERCVAERASASGLGGARGDRSVGLASSLGARREHRSRSGHVGSSTGAARPGSAAVVGDSASTRRSAEAAGHPAGCRRPGARRSTPRVLLFGASNRPRGRGMRRALGARRPSWRGQTGGVGHAEVGVVGSVGHWVCSFPLSQEFRIQES